MKLPTYWKEYQGAEEGGMWRLKAGLFDGFSSVLLYPVSKAQGETRRCGKGQEVDVMVPWLACDVVAAEKSQLPMGYAVKKVVMAFASRKFRFFGVVCDLLDLLLLFFRIATTKKPICGCVFYDAWLREEWWLDLPPPFS